MYAASHAPVSLAGHSDSIVMACAHTWMTGRHVSPVHGCAVCEIAHSGNIVLRHDVVWHEVASGFFQYFIVLDR